MRNPLHKGWLKKEPNDLIIARCYVSHEKISLSAAGQSAFSDHGGSKKHTDALKKRLEFFNKPKEKSSNTAIRISSSTSSSTPNTDQSSVDCVTDDVKLKTEIIWVLKCVLAGYSNRSCDGIDKIFTRTFSVTLPKSLNLVDKNQYILQPMASRLTSSRCCNRKLQNHTSWYFSFDESLNSITQSCEISALLE